jgi:two-component system invasion response regulator UvrY
VPPRINKQDEEKSHAKTQRREVKTDDLQIGTLEAEVIEAASDVAIIDVSLGGADGIQLIARMKAVHPNLIVIVLSMHDDSANVLRAFKAGAQAYVIKTDPPRELSEAVNGNAGGDIFLSSRLRRNPVFKVLYDSESMIGQLTDRESRSLDYDR